MPSLFSKYKKTDLDKLSSFLKDEDIYLSQAEMKKAAENDAETIHKIADIYFKRNKYSKSFKWYLKAALQNYPNSQNEVGWMYRNGFGVSKDYAQAMEWYLRAEQNGSSMAQNNIGYMYCNGLGVSKSYKAAMEWYQKAASNGNAHAQNNIGHLYEHGLGVTQNYTAAMNWYLRAGMNRDISAQTNIARFYQNGLGVAKDVNLAIEWYLKADGFGSMTASYNLGWIFEFEFNDKEKAIEWYSKCAKHGHNDANNRLKIVATKDFSIIIETREEKQEFRWEIEEMTLEPASSREKIDKTTTTTYPNPSKVDDSLGESGKQKKLEYSHDPKTIKDSKVRELEERVAQLMVATSSRCATTTPFITTATTTDDPQNDIYYDDSSDDEINSTSKLG